jgi:hypothetical protein
MIPISNLSLLFNLIFTNKFSNKHFSHIFIMGDFNYPNIDWENCNSNGDSTESIEYKFIGNLQDGFLFQHIKKKH